MNTQLRRLINRGEDDAGVALLAAIALVGIVGVLSLAVLAFSMREIGLTGHDRQRTSSISSAEGSLDQALASVQGADPTTLPCGAILSTVQSGPDSVDLSTDVEYFTPAGLPMLCSDVKNPAIAVGSATVKVTGTAKKLQNEQPAVRSMETLVTLKPNYSNKLSNAIFADAGLSLSNNGTVFGQGGKPNANLYTNGNFDCNNNQTYHGSVYAKGAFSMSGSCTIDGDVYAGSLVSGSSGAIGGNLKIVTGNLNFSGTVGQKVYYTSPNTVSWSGCGTINTPPLPTDKCQSRTGMTVPSQTFPQVTWNSINDPGWATAGFTNIVTLPAAGYPCAISGKLNGPAQWLKDYGQAAGPNTILKVNCPVEGVYIDSPSTIDLAKDIAVFSSGPFTIAKVGINPSDGLPHNLYFIQPYDAIATPCTNGISIDNLVSVDSKINMLLYTPCNINKANNSTTYGQIYAGGTTTINNKLTMYYQEVPIWGVTNSTNLILGYDVSIEYKREAS